MNDFTFDVGLAGKLKQSSIRNGTDAALIDWLCGGDMLAKLEKVRLGHAIITAAESWIDLDAEPYCPAGFEVETHQKGGQFKWDPAKISLFLSTRQHGFNRINCTDLRNELRDKPVVNANLLDYLLEHPHLVPEDWKDKWVFFWGTIYRSPSGHCVRYLFWNRGQADWRYCPPHHFLDRHNPAALLGS